MSDADFLRQIIADPDSDGPRLIYADWLEIQGQSARAEFIRIQCARAKLPPDDPRTATLQQRETILLEQHRLTWSAPLAGLATSWEFVRGFPDRIRIEARLLLARADELFAAAPVQYLDVHDVQNLVQRLVQENCFARLVGLKISSTRLGNALPKALAQAKDFNRLLHLHLGRNAIGDDGVRILASTALFAQLATLDLSENTVGPAGAVAIAGSSHFERLGTLNLRGNPIVSAGAHALLSSPRLLRLSWLSMAQANIRATALEGIGNGGPAIATLDLSENDVGDSGVGHLALWPKSLTLRDLDLSRNDIGDAGASVLAEARNLSGLRRLALNGNRITEIGKRALTASPQFTRLAALELRENWTPLAVLRR